MHRYILQFILAMLPAIATAQTGVLPPDSSTKLKQLYVCYYFFQNGIRSIDEALRAKSEKLSGTFLFKATAIAVDAGGEPMALSMSQAAEIEFKSFIVGLRQLPPERRNEELIRFDSDCSSTLDSKIEYEREDRTPTFATDLYFCSKAYAMLSTQNPKEASSQFSQLSTDMRNRADELASKKGVRPVDPLLEQQGDQRAKSWFEKFSSKSDEEAKGPLLRKLDRTCRSAMKKSTQ